jgi:hypothetical protein
MRIFGCRLTDRHSQLICANDAHCTWEFLLFVSSSSFHSQQKNCMPKPLPTQPARGFCSRPQHTKLWSFFSFFIFPKKHTNMTMTSTRRGNKSKCSSSLLTMSTKAFVLCLASTSSCAAYSNGSVGGGGGRRVRAVTAGEASQPWRSRRSSGSGGRLNQCRRAILSPTATPKMTTILYYRDGDDDQPLTMQAANQSAVDEAVVMMKGGDGASPSVGTSAQEFVTTPSGHPNLPIMILLSSRFAKSILPTSIRSITTIASPLLRDEQLNQSKEQLVMDEYLEFVQRRYNRLHIITTSTSTSTSTPKQTQSILPSSSSSSHQRPSKPNNNIFLSRLTLSHRPLSLFSQPTTSTPSSSRRIASNDVSGENTLEEDPLQALGLSSLASDKLRQRLHVHVQPTTSVAFVNYPMTTQDTTTATTTTAAEAASRSVTSFTDGARRQMKHLLEALHRIIYSFLYTFLVEGGGLRHSARILSVISVVLVAFVSRHVFKQSG